MQGRRGETPYLPKTYGVLGLCLQALVNQLDTPPDPALNHADVQLEAIVI